jgi:hypothetical protein
LKDKEFRSWKQQLQRFLQRLNMVEQEQNYFRERTTPQGHLSINQSNEARGGHEAIPMEIEENTLENIGRQDG